MEDDDHDQTNASADDVERPVGDLSAVDADDGIGPDSDPDGRSEPGTVGQHLSDLSEVDPTRRSTNANGDRSTTDRVRTVAADGGTEGCFGVSARALFDELNGGPPATGGGRPGVGWTPEGVVDGRGDVSATTLYARTLPDPVSPPTSSGRDNPTPAPSSDGTQATDDDVDAMVRAVTDDGEDLDDGEAEDALVGDVEGLFGDLSGVEVAPVAGMNDAVTDTPGPRPDSEAAIGELEGMLTDLSGVDVEPKSKPEPDPGTDHGHGSDSGVTKDDRGRDDPFTQPFDTASPFESGDVDAVFSTFEEVDPEAVMAAETDPTTTAPDVDDRGPAPVETGDFMFLLAGAETDDLDDLGIDIYDGSENTAAGEGAIASTSGLDADPVPNKSDRRSTPEAPRRADEGVDPGERAETGSGAVDDGVEPDESATAEAAKTTRKPDVPGVDDRTSGASVRTDPAGADRENDREAPAEMNGRPDEGDGSGSVFGRLRDWLRNLF